MYELFYWPGIQGRGELIRLALEDAGAPYVDVARKEGGMAAMQAIVAGTVAVAGPRPFAPPFLRDGDLVLAHSANVLQYLGERLPLVAASARWHAHQLQLSITDLYAEAHDTHHPIGSSLYYEDQKPEALRRTKAFVQHRLPKFLGYFEQVLVNTGSPFLLGEHSYADLSLFQVVEGLRYAFPRATAALESKFPRILAVHERVRQRPSISAYLASPRRLPFNEHGIFRRYPELDVVPEEP